MTANQEVGDICSRADGDVPQVLLQELSVFKAVLVNLGTLIYGLCHPHALGKMTQTTKHKQGPPSTKVME